MTDIVERLRQEASRVHPQSHDCRLDAAVEIERLRAQNELLWEIVKLLKEQVNMQKEAISDTCKILRGET